MSVSPVIEGDIDGIVVRDPFLGRIDSGKLVSEEVDDGLKIQLRGQALLDIINDGQLTVALFSLPEQALRLIKEARILQSLLLGLLTGSTFCFQVPGVFNGDRGLGRKCHSHLRMIWRKKGFFPFIEGQHSNDPVAKISGTPSQP